jgi:hypothetical protein
MLCSDLDRTVLPNGTQPESPPARPRFRAAAARAELTLVYVSGRNEALLHEAIRRYAIPEPAFAIGDVGTTLYAVRSGTWRAWERWTEEIAPDWDGAGGADLAPLFRDLHELRLQEPGKQNTYKLSFYAPPELDHTTLLAEMRSRLARHGVRANLVWSVDETVPLGLLDVLPARANKLHAIRFLMEELGFDGEQTVYAGDSGNDLPVLTSGLPAVLVRNATGAVRDEALRAAAAGAHPGRLYLARGGYLGMNGNYSAGVLEGLAHFHPQATRWIENA